MSIREANTNRVLSIGSTSRDRDRNILKQSILRDFEKQPTFYECNRNGEYQGFQIVNNEKVDDLKTIICKPDEIINTGDVIDWNDKWIVINTEYFNNLYWKGTIQQANNTLKFYTKDNESGISWVENIIPIIVESEVRLYSMGQDDDRFMSIPSTNIVVRIPFTDITSQIKRDDIFKIGQENYMVIDKSDIIQNGLLVLKMKWTEIQQIIQTNIYGIELLSSPSISLNSLGQSSIIEVKCMINGEVDPSPTLSIINDNESVCTVDESTMTILCLGEGVSNISIEYYGQVVNIVVTGVLVDEDNYSLAVSGSNFIKINQQATYNAVVTNNGMVDMKNVSWELFADDGVSITTLANIYSISGVYNENCVIKANGNHQYGYVKLKCALLDESCPPLIKRIQIKSLL